MHFPLEISHYEERYVCRVNTKLVFLFMFLAFIKSNIGFAQSINNPAITMPTRSSESVVGLYQNDSQKEKLLYNLLQNLRCVVCQNQSLAESDAQIAIDLRKLVTQWFFAGINEEEIKKRLQDRYGDYILFQPPFNSLTAALWILPFLLLFLTVFGSIIYYIIYSNKRKKAEK